jgi:hypothetical protein
VKKAFDSIGWAIGGRRVKADHAINVELLEEGIALKFVPTLS